METTEGFERHMREVLHAEDGQAAGFSAAQVIAKGRHRQRARTAAVSGVALVAAGAVAVVPSVVGGGHGQGGVISAAGGPVPSTAAPSTSAGSARVVVPPSPSARVVKPGTIDLGNGYSMTLTSNSLTVAGNGGQVGPNYTDNGNQGSGSISLKVCGALIAGLYIGGGDAATGTVTVDGTAYPATVVTLAGHPGWSVAYAMLPASPKFRAPMSISVSDAAGHQLASFSSPIH